MNRGCLPPEFDFRSMKDEDYSGFAKNVLDLSKPNVGIPFRVMTHERPEVFVNPGVTQHAVASETGSTAGMSQCWLTGKRRRDSFDGEYPSRQNRPSENHTEPTQHLKKGNKQNTTGIPTKREPTDPSLKTQAKTEAERKPESERPGQTQGAEDLQPAAQESTRREEREHRSPQPATETVTRRGRPDTTKASAANRLGDGPKRNDHQRNHLARPNKNHKDEGTAWKEKADRRHSDPENQRQEMIPRNQKNKKGTTRTGKDQHTKRAGNRQVVDPSPMSAKDLSPP
ncbi:hypothetical protein NDU88_007143 [Pleurodeles waltl]|uniref:Uncharacterized protein n=1 Tax=Pleurodeles waltl TaxID=8319 RepID=A0AAV7QL64_PLEWA|nr:hypothetical protein NDU88_007143 [Pleurodeles waltl]